MARTVSRRKPQGTYVRLTPDQFSESAFASSASVAAVVGSRSRLALFNDSPDGRIFHVYGFWASTDTGSLVHVSTVDLVTMTDIGPCSPIVTPGAFGPGKLQYNNPASPPATRKYWLHGPANTRDEIMADYPLCVLRMGSWFHLTTADLNSTLNGGFYYIVLNDTQ